MRCPDTAVFRPSPPLVARPSPPLVARSLTLTRLPIFAVARATQVYRRKRNQPGINERAIALARSDHPTATGESAPSVTLPPTSPHFIVWCGDTPVVHRSLGDRCERHKRAPRLEWAVARPVAAPGSAWGRTNRAVPITNRHDSSWFESFRSNFARPRSSFFSRLHLGLFGG